MKPAITIELEDGRSSQIYIGSGLLEQQDWLTELLHPARIALVSNQLVASLYGHAIQDLNLDAETILIGDGEQYKSLEVYGDVMDELIKRRFNRDATIVALGGGVVGDLAGFVAATYQRGIRLCQIPTTLLAQVDSAIGGKTAVNHATGKNLIGAFYQPEMVVIDTEVLKSLPTKVFVEGLAEVIKYGVIYDAEFFEWLEDNAANVLSREAEALQFIVRRSCEIKAAVVAADEREQGLRNILNYGHTFGHAFEALTQYGELLHGEAVSIGMVCAANLAFREGICDQRTALRVKNIASTYGLPTEPPTIDVEHVKTSMAMDKKVLGGSIRFVLPTEIGTVKVTSDYDDENLTKTLAAS